MTHPIRNLKAKYQLEVSLRRYEVTRYDPKTRTSTTYWIGGAK